MKKYIVTQETDRRVILSLDNGSGNVLFTKVSLIKLFALFFVYSMVAILSCFSVVITKFNTNFTHWAFFLGGLRAIVTTTGPFRLGKFSGSIFSKQKGEMAIDDRC